MKKTFRILALLFCLLCLSACSGRSGGDASPQASSAGAEEIRVTVSADCLTVLDHPDDLAPGYAAFIPKDGILLPDTKITLPAGATAFDAVKAACAAAGIPLEIRGYATTTYIVAIAQIGEKICGESSGWIYLVNGSSPQVGCSNYPLQDGDTVRWRFSCTGFGADVQETETPAD